MKQLTSLVKKQLVISLEKQEIVLFDKMMLGISNILQKEPNKSTVEIIEITEKYYITNKWATVYTAYSFVNNKLNISFEVSFHEEAAIENFLLRFSKREQIPLNTIQ
ncbi:MAG: hypothetical protein WCP92_09285 [bacterium]